MAAREPTREDDERVLRMLARRDQGLSPAGIARELGTYGQLVSTTLLLDDRAWRKSEGRP